MYNLIITNSKGGITRFELPAQNGAQVLIGRDKGCDVALTDETSLSRVHLVLTVMDDSILIQDNHSSNGLFRDSQKIESEYMLTGKTYYAANCSFVLVKKVVPLKKAKPAPRPQPAAPAVDYYSEPADAETLKAALAATCAIEPQDEAPQPADAAYYGEPAEAAPQPADDTAYYSEPAEAAPQPADDVAYYGEPAEAAPQPADDTAYYGEPADVAPQPADDAAYYGEPADVAPQPADDTAYYGEPAEAAPQPADDAAYYGEPAEAAPQPADDTAYYGEPAEAAPQPADDAASYGEPADVAPEAAPAPEDEAGQPIDAGDTAPPEIPADTLPPQQTEEEPALAPAAAPAATAPRVTVKRPKGSASRVPKPMHNSVPGAILGLPCDFDLSIRIFSVREKPQGGDLLSFGAKADRTCYIYLFQYDSGGEGVLLVPGMAGENNKLFRGVETRFPSVGDHNYDIMVEEPYGQDTIIALACSGPCDFEKIWEQCYQRTGAGERTPGHVETAAIRTALARHKQLKWSSAIIKLTTCAPQ